MKHVPSDCLLSTAFSPSGDIITDLLSSDNIFHIHAQEKIQWCNMWTCWSPGCWLSSFSPSIREHVTGLRSTPGYRTDLGPEDISTQSIDIPAPPEFWITWGEPRRPPNQKHKSQDTGIVQQGKQPPSLSKKMYDSHYRIWVNPSLNCSRQIITLIGLRSRNIKQLKIHIKIKDNNLLLFLMNQINVNRQHVSSARKRLHMSAVSSRPDVTWRNERQTTNSLQFGTVSCGARIFLNVTT